MFRGVYSIHSQGANRHNSLRGRLPSDCCDSPLVDAFVRVVCGGSHCLDRRFAALRRYLGRCRRRLFGRNVGWLMDLCDCDLDGASMKERRMSCRWVFGVSLGLNRSSKWYLQSWAEGKGVARDVLFDFIRARCHRES